jgi:hypothetical protein
MYVQVPMLRIHLCGSRLTMTWNSERSITVETGSGGEALRQLKSTGNRFGAVAVLRIDSRPIVALRCKPAIRPSRWQLLPKPGIQSRSICPI